MSKILKEYKFTPQGSLTNKSRKNYPWDKWLNGKIWEITKGNDFSCLTTTMTVYLHNKATSCGLSIRTNQKENSVIFQAYKKDYSC